MSTYSCNTPSRLIYRFSPHLSPSLLPPLLYFLLLLLFSRAVMGLDRESDVVHIETRVAKGRECSISVHRSGGTRRNLCLSFRRRSMAEWDLLRTPEWLSPDKNGGFRRADASLNGSPACHRRISIPLFEASHPVRAITGGKNIRCSFGQECFFKSKAH